MTITEADVEAVRPRLAARRSAGRLRTGRTSRLNAPNSERSDYGQVVLERRLRDALGELNPGLPAEALDDAFRKLTRPEGATLEARNRAFHRMLVDGVTVEHRTDGGAMRGAQARVVDFDDPGTNDWLAVNQLTVTENKNTRRPDVVLFVNGLPLGVIELKNPVDEDATVWTAWQQLQTYKAELPTLFSMNEMLMVSDGTQARIGTLTAGREWFKPWRTVTGEAPADPHMTELQVMLEGVCAPDRFASLVRDFIVFEDDGGGAQVKKMAGYHQFHAVRVAVGETLRAAALQREARETGEGGGRYEAGPEAWRRDRRPAHRGRLAHPGLRQESDNGLLRRGRRPGAGDGEPDHRRAHGPQRPGRPALWHVLALPRPAAPASGAGGEPRLTCAASCRWSREAWCSPPSRSSSPRRRATPIPQLSDRRNIVVIADEAHRSQYDFVDGYARHMRDALPNASFVGFTGTPIELQDANTRAVFGDYISIYDIQRSVEDGATVPIYYESRLAKLALDEDERPSIDPAFEEATEGEEVERKEKLKTRWAQLEAVVGAEKRVKLIAEDIVAHFEQRLEALEGKAMVVCMSRRICIDLYRELVRLRPDWRGDDDSEGAIKVVMTGSASDPPGLAAAHPQRGAARGPGQPLPRPRRPAPRSCSCAICG